MSYSDPALVLGVLLALAAGVLWFAWGRKAESATALVLAAVMLVLRRKPSEEEPDEREEQDGQISQMDDVVEGATRGESDASRSLREWARKMRNP